MRVASVLALLVAGCASQQEFMWRPGPNMAMRDAGRMTQQFEIDSVICNGDMQRAGLSAPPIGTPLPPDHGNAGQALANFGVALSDYVAAGNRERAMLSVYDACMYQRGYVKTPKPNG